MDFPGPDMRYFFPEVLQVVPTDDYKVYAYFNDGTIRLHDVRPLIKSGTVFSPLEDITFFKSKCTVINHTVAWDVGGNYDPEKCVDIDPFTVYNSPVVADPLEDHGPEITG